MWNKFWQPTWHSLWHLFGSVRAQPDLSLATGFGSVRAQTAVELAKSFWGDGNYSTWAGICEFRELAEGRGVADVQQETRVEEKLHFCKNLEIPHLAGRKKWEKLVSKKGTAVSLKNAVLYFRYLAGLNSQNLPHRGPKDPSSYIELGDYESNVWMNSVNMIYPEWNCGFLDCSFKFCIRENVSNKCHDMSCVLRISVITIDHDLNGRALDCSVSVSRPWPRHLKSTSPSRTSICYATGLALRAARPGEWWALLNAAACHDVTFLYFPGILWQWQVWMVWRCCSFIIHPSSQGELSNM